MKNLLGLLKHFFALLGGVLLCIQIYSWWIEPKRNLSAKIHIAAFAVPVNMKEYLSIETRRIEIDSSYRRLKRVGFSNVDYDSIRAGLPLSQINDLLGDVEQYGVLTITNSGTKEINDIQLSGNKVFPVFFEFANKKGEIITGSGKRLITLGDLRPSEEIAVKIWSRYIYPEDIRVTYADGSISPTSSTTVTGFQASFIEMFSNRTTNFMLILIILLFLISIGGFLYTTGLRNGKTSYLQLDEEGNDKLDDSKSNSH